MFNIDDLKADTIPGTDPGSVYMVLGTKDDLKVGLKPMIYPTLVPDVEGDGIPVLMVGGRLRVVPANPQGSLMIVSNVFPTFANKGEWKEGDNYVSCLFGMPFVLLPASPYEVLKLFKSSDIVNKVAVALHAVLLEQGLKNTPTPEALFNWMSDTYESSLPEMNPVVETALDGKLHFNTGALI